MEFPVIKIDCDCDDPSCPGRGEESEVHGHIEDCPCHYCHHQMGKVSSHIDWSKK